jgi:hypothetical protein
LDLGPDFGRLRASGFCGRARTMMAKPDESLMSGRISLTFPSVSGNA